MCVSEGGLLGVNVNECILYISILRRNVLWCVAPQPLASERNHQVIRRGSETIQIRMILEG